MAVLAVILFGIGVTLLLRRARRVRRLQRAQTKDAERIYSPDDARFSRYPR